MQEEQAQRFRVLPASMEKKIAGHRLLTAESRVTTGQITLDSFLGLCSMYSQADRLWLGCVTLKDPCGGLLSRSPSLKIEFLSS